MHIDWANQEIWYQGSFLRVNFKYALGYNKSWISKNHSYDTSYDVSYDDIIWWYVSYDTLFLLLLMNWVKSWYNIINLKENIYFCCKIFMISFIVTYEFFWIFQHVNQAFLKDIVIKSGKTKWFELFVTDFSFHSLLLPYQKLIEYR